MASSPETTPPTQTNSSSLNNTPSNSSSPPPSPPATSAPPPASPSLPLPPPPSPPSQSPPTTSTPPPSSPGGSSPPSLPSPLPPQPSPTLPSPSKPPPSSANFAPPPPPKRPTKTTPPSNPQPSSDDENADSKKSSGGSDFNLPMVAGVAAGIALFILIIAIAACVCCGKKKKKNKKRNHNPMRYYSDSDVKGSDYYSSGAGPPKWHNGGPDGAMNMPLPPAMAWHAPPPPSITSEISMEYSGLHGPALPPPSPSLTLGFIKSTFSYEQLALATNGFSHENLLGQGGFGYVYKGLLPNGTEVAVKQLKAGSGQGEREFQAEVEIISRVHHRHLVSLVGYCIAGSQRLLVYEFVPNKTLEFHLQIARALEGDSSLDDLNEGVKPGQSMLFSSSSDYDSGSYASNMSRLRRVAFGSNDISQEYSGRTSDYGLNPSTSSSSGEMKDIGSRSNRGRIK